MTPEDRLMISLLQQLNKAMVEAVKLEKFIVGELLKKIEERENREDSNGND